MKVGIAGCGQIGRRHASHFRQIDGVELVACFDADIRAAESLGGDFGVPVCTDLDAFLARPMDGVTVCTPPSAHMDVVVPALASGMSVLCEKPLARTVKDCQSVTTPERLACAFKFRHLSGAQRLRELLASGELGQVVGVRATAVSSVDMSGRWFSVPEISGGGVILDNGVHLVDLCRYLLGPIDSVCAQTSAGTRGLRVEESAFVGLRMKCGVTAQLLLSWEAPAPMPPLVEIYATGGCARLGYALDVFGRNGGERVMHVPAEGTDVWRETMLNFVHFVRDGRPPSATYQDGMAAVAAAEAAYASARTGEWVRPAAA